MVSKDQVDAARSQENTAVEIMQASKDELDGAKNQLTINAGDVNRLEKRLADLATKSTSSLTKQLNTAEKLIEKLLGKQQEQRKLGDRIAEIKILLLAMAEELSTLEAKAKNDNEQYIQAEASAAEIQKRIPRQYRESDVVANSLLELDKQVQSLTAAVESAEQSHTEDQSALDKAISSKEALDKQHRGQEKQTASAESAWNKTLEKSLFDNVEAFKQSLLVEQEQVALKAEIDEFRSGLDSLKGAVSQLKSELAKKIMPDIESLDVDFAEKTNFFRMVDESWRELEERSNLLNSVQTKLKVAHIKNAEFEKQYKVIGTLSAVANGQTGDKISLNRFVLSVLLDDVLIQASQRLMIMSKGRYRLIRKEDRTKGNKASGLDLMVEDGDTGKPRAVATLSGGESFMAALSLALGLSDVVQSYAGGIKLDTLFIDEGFGSLDSESLDEAIRVLIDLQASGRMIGIISHVSGLKEQMACRLDVVSGKLGSSISTIAA